jgi:serine O-acetyltransferase
MVKHDILRTYNMLEGSRLRKIIGCYRSPGVHAIVIFRFGQWLKQRNILLRLLLEPVYMLLYRSIRIKWGIEIPRSAQIGEGFFIGHSGGIVISDAAKIGRNVNISHQVTIGLSGQGERRGVPTIGDNVYIAPGAKIFGKIHVGNNAKIGANAVIFRDIPENAIVVLDPGFKIVSLKGNRPITASADRLELYSPISSDLPS